MNALAKYPDTERYAHCIKASKATHWDIDRDVIKGRAFDLSRKYLPDGLSLAHEFTSLSDAEKRLVSQIQGRTYANMFGLVERYIGAKLLEVTRGHALGDQLVVESLVRFTDEELKHQELFRRLEAMMAADMPPGYVMTADPNAVAQAVLSKSNWAVLALTLHIELFVQLHYRQSIEPDENLSPLYKDVFFFHMKEESTHALMDELEWLREDKKLNPGERDRAIDELIGLVAAVDGILQAQSKADVEYFLKYSVSSLGSEEIERMKDGVLKAYRWQYIFSGVGHPRFKAALGNLITKPQNERIEAALKPLMA